MKNRILGAIGVLWGGSVAFHTFAMEHAGGSGGYRAGQNTAGAFGILMFMTGLYYLIKGAGKAKSGQ